MLGIATAIIGELITGKGALGQLGLETGVPITEIEPLILAGIGFNLVRRPAYSAVLKQTALHDEQLLTGSCFPCLALQECICISDAELLDGCFLGRDRRENELRKALLYFAMTNNLVSETTLRCAQIAAFLPAKGKFVPDEEEEMARPKGALQDPSISLANPSKVSGLPTSVLLLSLSYIMIEMDWNLQWICLDHPIEVVVLSRAHIAANC